MQSIGYVYYPYSRSGDSPYRFDIPKGSDLNKLLDEMRKAHPRHHRIVLKVYSNPYEDWDMQGEKVEWLYGRDRNSRPYAFYVD